MLTLLIVFAFETMSRPPSPHCAQTVYEHYSTRPTLVPRTFERWRPLVCGPSGTSATLIDAEIPELLRCEWAALVRGYAGHQRPIGRCRKYPAGPCRRRLGSVHGRAANRWVRLAFSTSAASAPYNPPRIGDSNALRSVPTGGRLGTTAVCTGLSVDTDAHPLHQAGLRNRSIVELPLRKQLLQVLPVGH